MFIVIVTVLFFKFWRWTRYKVHLFISFSLVAACKMILHIHVVVNWQLLNQCIRWLVWHERIASPGVEPSRLRVFFEVLRWQVTRFQLIAGSTLSRFLCNGYKFMFDVNYKFINGSFAFSLALNLSITLGNAFYFSQSSSWAESVNKIMVLKVVTPLVLWIKVICKSWYCCLMRYLFLISWWDPEMWDHLTRFRGNWSPNLAGPSSTKDNCLYLTSPVLAPFSLVTERLSPGV